MNDILQALYKERRQIEDRAQIIHRALLQKAGGLIDTPYTSNDHALTLERLSDVEVAIKAIRENRRKRI